MKKKYSAPAMEKIVFDYQDVLTSSMPPMPPLTCRSGGEYSDSGIGCQDNYAEWRTMN